jgi:hypothetical protein
MALPPIIQELFKSIGLESLTQWAANAIINGWSESQVMLELYERPEFKDRFAGMFALKAKNKPPISINEYLAYEKSIHSLAAMWGMEVTKQEIDEMIGGEVSMMEAERRMDIAAAAVYESDAEERSELERMFGINLGQQMKFWMDPKRELGVLQQNYRMAQVAGAALRTGYGQITIDQAQRLTEAGVSKEQAITGFGELVKSAELFTPLSSGELEITDDQQIELLAGDADVRELLAQRQRSRSAEFEGGGSYAVSDKGFATGLAE